jgi:hypothetical protein
MRDPWSATFIVAMAMFTMGIFLPHIFDPNGRYLEYTNPDGSHVHLIHNASAQNPTFKQVAAFLASDDTDRLKYIPGKFVCSNFAERVQNNAENAGYTCGWVAIQFDDDNTRHSCNVFNTVDRGLVFVDCTGSIDPNPEDSFDTIADLEVGQIYQVTAITGATDVYYPPLGTVKSYSIFW